MTKEEFMAMILPYNLKLFSSEGKTAILTSGFGISIGRYSYEFSYEWCLRNEYGYKPIIRPLSDLSKSIVQSDYNEGKPFIPLHVLNSMFQYDGLRLVHYINSGLGWKIDFCFHNVAISTRDMLKPIQMLIKWHFWPDMPEGEQVVYVSDDFNPYA